MAKWTYTHGLHDLGGGTWAWLQPDGGWGWSNAGLIESDGEALLVDTLMGVNLTRDMLAAMRASIPAAAKIDRLVNTHSNVDHTLGNQLMAGAEIIAAGATAEAIAAFNPAELADQSALGGARRGRRLLPGDHGPDVRLHRRRGDRAQPHLRARADAAGGVQGRCG